MNPRIKTATANEDYSFNLIFQNGEQGNFDIKPYLEIGKFKELKDLRNFRRFKLEDGVIKWFNGLDISPDTVYMLKH
jgi:hypothetical protein